MKVRFEDGLRSVEVSQDGWSNQVEDLGCAVAEALKMMGFGPVVFLVAFARYLEDLDFIGSARGLLETAVRDLGEDSKD